MPTGLRAHPPGAAAVAPPTGAKLWTALIKDAGSKYAETHGILSDQLDGFRKHRSIHDAL
jgi:hypothetical protein